jgi:RNA polymerase sigma-70 factor (ECF subfamily)
MARHRPPPDWHQCEERNLEDLFRGEDEELARYALVELRQRHQDELRRRARHKGGGNKDLEEEAMQQLDTRMWEKRKLYIPDKGRWKNWAKIILDRIIVDMFRQRARIENAPTVQSADPDSSPGEGMAQIPGREPQPDQQLKLQDLQKAMADCLQRLSPEERTALILQIFEDRTLEEIAEQTQVPRATVGTRVYRAKQKMRDCLKGKGYEGGEV